MGKGTLDAKSAVLEFDKAVPKTLRTMPGAYFCWKDAPWATPVMVVGEAELPEELLVVLSTAAFDPSFIGRR